MTNSRKRARSRSTILSPTSIGRPFFHTWELRGRYPAIFDDPTVGQQARELFDDAQKLLERIRSEKLIDRARCLRVLAGEGHRR